MTVRTACSPYSCTDLLSLIELRPYLFSLTCCAVLTFDRVWWNLLRLDCFSYEKRIALNMLANGLDGRHFDAARDSNDLAISFMKLISRSFVSTVSWLYLINSLCLVGLSNRSEQ